MNHQKLQRLWREEGLRVPQCLRRKRTRLRVSFSFSRSFNRFASSAFSPPNWLRYRQ